MSVFTHIFDFWIDLTIAERVFSRGNQKLNVWIYFVFSITASKFSLENFLDKKN